MITTFDQVKSYIRDLCKYFREFNHNSSLAESYSWQIERYYSLYEPINTLEYE